MTPQEMKVEMIRAALVKIADRLGRPGHLTINELIEAARDPRHPLHGEFDWDDAVAAHEAWEALSAKGREDVRRRRLKGPALAVFWRECIAKALFDMAGWKFLPDETREEQFARMAADDLIDPLA